MDKLEDNLPGTTIEQSDFGMKNNPDASVVAKVVNADVELTADASKTHKEDDNMNISVKEEKKTV